jgi:hypothetical protein
MTRTAALGARLLFLLMAAAVATSAALDAGATANTYLSVFPSSALHPVSRMHYGCGIENLNHQM